MIVPFELTFQSQYTLDCIKTQDKSGHFKKSNSSRWPDVLSPEEKALTNRPYLFGTKPKVVNQIYDGLLLPPHCLHCPRDTAWYLTMHLLIEDENYSNTSRFLAYFIIFLIAVSSASYVLQTIPSLEERP